MASLRVLAFDHEGRPVKLDTWLDSLQLYLLSDSKDSVSLFDLASGAATAPPATADSSTRSQWLTPQALYDAVVARYSFPATAALGYLLLPYLFPELSAFATVEDLVSHLRARTTSSLLTPPPSLLTTSSSIYSQLRLVETCDRAGHTCGRLHTQHRCFSRLDDAWRAEFGDDVELPRWADQLKSRIAIFDLDFDAILSAMYALSVSAEGDCYRCVPPDPGIAATALGASESSTLPGTMPAEAFHTFTLDSGASRYFFRDSTTLIPLPATVPVRLVDPSGGPDVMVTTTTPGGQRVSICTCTLTGRHLATFTCRSGSSLYTLAIEPSQVAASAQVSASGQVAASYSCRLLSHQTLLWHHRLGHPSLPRLRGMLSRLLVSGLPRSLPALPPSPAPPCLPCVEGWQRAAPQSSSFPPMTAPLQTLHMDVWGPARVSGQSRERYFLLVVDDYARYTTVFPLRSKGQDLPVLRLHSDRGGEFSSNLLRDFCRGEGILPSFTLPDSPQQNGIAECRIGLVIEVARTSMIHIAAPHFLSPFAVRYAAHQLNLCPRVSLPETSPTLRWTGEVGDASVFRVWGSRAFVRDTSADKLSPRAIPCVFLGFVPDAPGWQFYHPTSRRVFPSQDVTFDKSVPFYRLFPYLSAPPPPLPLFLAPGPPPVDPLPPQGPAPSGVASGGAASGGVEPRGAEFEGAKNGGAEPGGVETGGGEPEGAEPGRGDPRCGGLRRGGLRCGLSCRWICSHPGPSPRWTLCGLPRPGTPPSPRWPPPGPRSFSPSPPPPRGVEFKGVAAGGGEPRGAEPEGVEPEGAASEGAESGGAEPLGAATSGGSAGASSSLSQQQFREWFVWRTRLWSGASGAGGAGPAGAGGPRVAAGAGVTRGIATTGPGGARTRGTGAAGTGGVEGNGAGDLTESCTTGAGGDGAGGAGVGGAGAGGAGTVDPGGTVRLRPYFVPLLQQVLGTPPSAALTPCENRTRKWEWTRKEMDTNMKT
ncbi:unnamed protein product [Closterium sp. NIES-54]